MSTCPYSDAELANWSVLTASIGDPCYTCDEALCYHHPAFLDAAIGLPAPEESAEKEGQP